MATCTWPTTLPSFSTATACRLKEFSSSTAQQSIIDLSTRIRGRGVLNCEAKAQVLVVMPSPLFFLEIGRKRGDVLVGQYGVTVCLRNPCERSFKVKYQLHEEMTKEREGDSAVQRQNSNRHGSKQASKTSLTSCHMESVDSCGECWWRLPHL